MWRIETRQPQPGAEARQESAGECALGRQSRRPVTTRNAVCQHGVALLLPPRAPELLETEMKAALAQ